MSQRSWPKGQKHSGTENILDFLSSTFILPSIRSNVVVGSPLYLLAPNASSPPWDDIGSKYHYDLSRSVKVQANGSRGYQYMTFC